MKATHISDVYHNFSSEALNADEMEAFYVPTDTVRADDSMMSNMKLLLEENLNKGAQDYLKVLFSGNRGSGKSTELNRLIEAVSKDFAVVKYSVEKETNPITLRYSELFIVTMQKLFELIEEFDLKVSSNYLTNIENWTRTKEIQILKEAAFGIGGDLGGGIPFFKIFFANVAASAKLSSSTQTLIKQIIEPRLRDLINLCNDLIVEIRLELIRKQRKGEITQTEILIVVEDMDKITLERAEELFYEYSPQLIQLQVHTIYTFPISLLYNTRFNSIRNNFDEEFELPMIKISEKDGTPYPKGRGIMEDIIIRRMDRDLFDDPGASILLLIEKSGGCLRDLFRMIKDACLSAQIKEREKISFDDVVKSVQKLKKDYKNTIAEKTDATGKTIYKASEYYAELARIASDPKKDPSNSDILLDLRQNLCVLGYNGEGWCDVHPLVRDILKDRGLISQ